jgi:hypothetical protein
MDEPSQQRLAAALEAEWIDLFRVSGSGVQGRSMHLGDDVQIFLVEIETLLFLHPHERRTLSRARRLLRFSKNNAALVAVHPLIHGRVATPRGPGTLIEQSSVTVTRLPLTKDAAG